MLRCIRSGQDCGSLNYHAYDVDNSRVDYHFLFKFLFVWFLQMPVLGVLSAYGNSPLFVTALASDCNGFVWAGTEEDGLYRMSPDGGDWMKVQTFSSQYGDNVFALHTDRSGLLWVGTLDCGLCSWNGETWSSYGIKNGLPGNRVFAISGATGDRLFVATDGGVADWNLRRSLIETFNRTSGLPQNEVCGIEENHGGGLYCATQCYGLMCRASPRAKFMHVAEMKDLRCNVMIALQDGGMAVGTVNGLWICHAKKKRFVKVYDGYVTAIHQTSDGVLFVGTREDGILSLDGRYNVKEKIRFSGVTNRITSFTSTARCDVYIGTYGGGVVHLPRNRHMRSRSYTAQFAARHPLSPKLKCVQSVQGSRLSKERDCFYVSDDWATKGDWCGRYGGRIAYLCSMDAPWGSHIIGRDFGYTLDGRIGEHHRKGDSLRHWVHQVITDNRNSLYSPKIGCRRQAEWDDHSETYPTTWEGPDLIVSVVITSGWHKVSFYFNNKDGHEGLNFRRDYTIEVDDGTGSCLRSRVVNFRNGVYKVFALNGPCRKQFRIRRNGSYSTILSGIFIDKFFEPIESQDEPRRSTWMYYGGVVYAPPKTTAFLLPPMNGYSGMSFDSWRQSVCRSYYLAYAQHESGEVLENYRWVLKEWTQEDHRSFDRMMLLAWTGKQFLQPSCRRADLFQLSPNVSKKLLDNSDFRCLSSDEWTKRPDVLNAQPVEEPYVGYFLKLKELHRRTNKSASY